MVHRKGISLFIVPVQIHFIQRKLFSKTNVNSHVFYKFQIFPECFRGPHVARVPVAGLHWLVTRQS